MEACVTSVKSGLRVQASRNCSGWKIIMIKEDPRAARRKGEFWSIISACERVLRVRGFGKRADLAFLKSKETRELHSQGNEFRAARKKPKKLSQKDLFESSIEELFRAAEQSKSFGCSIDNSFRADCDRHSKFGKRRTTIRAKMNDTKRFQMSLKATLAIFPTDHPRTTYLGHVGRARLRSF
jgi:hypothetical protein